MKKIVAISSLIAVLLLSGCLPSFGTDQEEVLQETEEQEEELVIIPDVQLTGDYYPILQPFKKSASRGLVVNRLHTKYDIQEAEEGLLRISTHYFDPENYYFQEGQYIDRDTTLNWLSRKSDHEDGLNPEADPSWSTEETAEKAPIYLAHILEQNYLIKTEQNKVRLDGISIGLALNSIYYTRDGKETRIPDSELEAQGKKMAAEIVNRLRAKDGLKDVAIVVGLFKQEKREAIVPGTYFTSAVAEKGKNELSGWTPINEEYLVLPASTTTDNYRDMNRTFSSFKQDVDEFFPSFVNVIGTIYAKDGKIQSLHIEVPVQFFGKSEMRGFTQYLTSLVMKHFADIQTEVSITSVNGPEALILIKPGDDEPFVHIYGY